MQDPQRGLDLDCGNAQAYLSKMCGRRARQSTGLRCGRVRRCVRTLRIRQADVHPLTARRIVLLLLLLRLLLYRSALRLRIGFARGLLRHMRSMRGGSVAAARRWHRDRRRRGDRAGARGLLQGRGPGRELRCMDGRWCSVAAACDACSVLLTMSGMSAWRQLVLSG